MPGSSKCQNRQAPWCRRGSFGTRHFLFRTSYAVLGVGGRVVVRWHVHDGDRWACMPRLLLEGAGQDSHPSKELPGQVPTCPGTREAPLAHSLCHGEMEGGMDTATPSDPDLPGHGLKPSCGARACSQAPTLQGEEAEAPPSPCVSLSLRSEMSLLFFRHVFQSFLMLTLSFI